ncbi:MAG: tetratricopeptide repeat protein [Rhizobiales bacterium]|nr:tetratricopeptide repeat protein [Hyphomicrobiales bacterium]
MAFLVDACRRLVTVSMLAFALASLAGCASLQDLAGGSRETPYGTYLSARFAAANHETEKAADLFAKALRDNPDDPDVLDRGFMLYATAGDLDRAAPLARQIIKVKPGHRLARLVLGLVAMKDRDYKEAKFQFASAEPGPFTALVGALAASWAEAGLKDKEAALLRLSTFDGRASFDLFRYFHQGLILDQLDDAAGAEAAYRKANDVSTGASIRVVQAYASFLIRHDRKDEARELLTHYLSLAPDHPLVGDDLERLDRNKRFRPLVTTPAQGVAEVLYGLGSALSQDSNSEMSALYLNMALYLHPDFDVARMLLAATYEQAKRYDESIRLYKEIGSSSPLYKTARIQAATDLDRIGKQDEAIKELSRLTGANATDAEPVIALGDIYRSKEDFAMAAETYGHALEIVGTPTERDWTLLYARGICFERIGEWSKAEADLKKALTLSNDHPLVLNYLGYSWIEQGIHLEEAVSMIERAVQQRPNDGFIIDSLGWARFRLGDYEQAVEYLERAVELEPGDPTINEHLGDAYWHVGRHLEARFQWTHALDMNPEEKRIPELRNKMDFGLKPGTDEPAGNAHRVALPGGGS